MLAELWRDEVLPENVAQRVQLPKNAPVDDRERVILTDAEFEAFMACPDVHAELHTMALVSRTLGGARTSDLHAWDWPTWTPSTGSTPTCPARRPRTAIGRLYPTCWCPSCAPWWDAYRRPLNGPVFPWLPDPVRLGPAPPPRRPLLPPRLQHRPGRREPERSDADAPRRPP